MYRLTDNEEVIREHLRDLRQREVTIGGLEKENAELHDKVNLLLQEKGFLSRELERVKVSACLSSFVFFPFLEIVVISVFLIWSY